MNNKPERKRSGAPLGNLNALKHGYYSKAFRKVERDDLDIIEKNLISELNALRVIGRRIMIQMKNSKLDQETINIYINTMIKITLSIGKLLNIQSIVENRQPAKELELENILTAIVEEMQTNQVYRSEAVDE